MLPRHEVSFTVLANLGKVYPIAPSPSAQKSVCILIATSFFHQEHHHESRSILSAKTTHQLSHLVLYPGARTCDGRSAGLSGAGRRPTGAKQATGSAAGSTGGYARGDPSARPWNESF